MSTCKSKPRSSTQSPVQNSEAIPTPTKRSPSEPGSQLPSGRPEKSSEGADPPASDDLWGDDEQYDKRLFADARQRQPCVGSGGAGGIIYKRFRLHLTR